MSKELHVLLSNRAIGHVAQHVRGRLSFTYDEAWREVRGAYSLSLSMPLAAASYPIEAPGVGHAGRSQGPHIATSPAL